jgi:RNA polymerase sigma-B factor
VTLLAPAAAPAVGSAEAGSERERRTRELVDELRACVASGSEGMERQTRLRQELVLANVSVATSIALRYRGRGEPFEDLAQCAYLGLVNAANGFDPRRGPDFLSYAVPTVAGEVKRHFRDHTWLVRPPRRLLELRVEVMAASGRLAQELGHSPTVAEIGRELSISQDEVIECLASAQGYRARSLDAPLSSGSSGDGFGTNGGTAFAEVLGEDDARLDMVENRLVVKPLLARLPPRDRRLLVLWFFHGQTQAQIGEQIGVTQMQVSRLITRALRVLRKGLTDEDDE